RRLPGRLQRRLRPPAVAGQAPLPFRNRRPAARRSRMARRQPVLRPVGLRLRRHAATTTTTMIIDRRGVMSSTRNMRKSVLSIAMGLCLASLASAPAFAQSVTGAVAGRAEPGSQVTVTNPATGLTRTVTVGADGSYRIGQLPPGDYNLPPGSGGPVAVNVSLGGTTQVNLSSGGALNLDTIQVIGSRVVNRVDVRSTESSTNLTREEYTRLPVDQSLGSVALLAPGVVPSASLGGLSF